LTTLKLSENRRLWWLFPFTLLVLTAAACGGEQTQQIETQQLGGACTGDNAVNQAYALRNQGYCTVACQVETASECAPFSLYQYRAFHLDVKATSASAIPYSRPAPPTANAPPPQVRHRETPKPAISLRCAACCAPCDRDIQCGEHNECLNLSSANRFAAGPARLTANVPKLLLLAGKNEKQCQPNESRRVCELGQTPCSPCSSDQECGGPNDACVPNLLTGKSYCGQDCNNSSCPEGFRLRRSVGQLAPGVKQCVPAGGHLRCRFL